MLTSSEKSAACRSLVNGRDLVWCQVDLPGVPKHVEGWSSDALLDAMENEGRVYDFLRPAWGDLVPHL
jgi:hypothetical protein